LSSADSKSSLIKNSPAFVSFQVAKALIELFGEMIFVHGFVHGDPHPGNILVCPQGHGKFSPGTHFAPEHGIVILTYNH
jgi:predicted unusual protein kinase regulating ubiquinone biosynthesis (AarF/ABC1/UbiB family)